MAFGKIKTVTMAGLAALTLGGGMLAVSAPAEAGYRGAYYGGPGFYPAVLLLEFWAAVMRFGW